MSRSGRGESDIDDAKGGGRSEAGRRHRGRRDRSDLRGAGGDPSDRAPFPAPQDDEGRLRAQEAAADRERNRPVTRELVEFEVGQEGEAGEGMERSGTLPGSFGGTTGTSGRSAGDQAPGSTTPPVRGIDPDEGRRRLRRRRYPTD